MGTCVKKGTRVDNSFVCVSECRSSERVCECASVIREVFMGELHMYLMCDIVSVRRVFVHVCLHQSLISC